MPSASSSCRRSTSVSLPPFRPPAGASPPPFRPGARSSGRCARPSSPSRRIRGDQLSVGAIERIQETVAIGMHQHLALDALDRDVGEHVLVVAVEIVGLGGRPLVVPDHFTGLRPECDNGRYPEGVARTPPPGPRPPAAPSPLRPSQPPTHALPD